MKKFSFILVLIIFILSTLACQLSGGPQPPRAVTVDQEQAKGFEKALQNASINQSGLVTIKITEAQISSYLTYNLTSDVSTYLSNPIILFEPNQIHIFGTVQGFIIPVAGKIVVEVSLQTKIPQIKIVSADFGIIPVPAALLSTLTDQINKEINKNVDKISQDYLLDSVTITTGIMILTLKKK